MSPAYEPIDLGPGFSTKLGQVFVDVARRRLAFRVTVEQGNPVDMCHGGAIATFADAQLVAVMGAPSEWRRHTPTISLSVDYLAPIALGAWLEAEVTLSKQTQTMLFTQALMTVDGETVARSSAIYRNREPIRS